jgi:hypothetical protein
MTSMIYGKKQSSSETLRLEPKGCEIVFSLDEWLFLGERKT